MGRLNSAVILAALPVGGIILRITDPVWGNVLMGVSLVPLFMATLAGPTIRAGSRAVKPHPVSFTNALSRVGTFGSKYTESGGSIAGVLEQDWGRVQTLASFPVTVLTFRARVRICPIAWCESEQGSCLRRT